VQQLTPSGAAYYAIIAVCLILTGGILTGGILSVEQRGSVLAAIVAVLGYVAWRGGRNHPPPDEGD
jgi:hypothetical protein